MKLRKTLTMLCAVGALGFGAVGCNNPNNMTGVVKERTNLDNSLPGCEDVGNVCRRVRICLNKNAQGQGTNCLDYKPSEVKNCPVGAKWPKCKTDK
jgi:hypothetical protein